MLPQVTCKTVSKVTLPGVPAQETFSSAVRGKRDGCFPALVPLVPKSSKVIR